MVIFLLIIIILILLGVNVPKLIADFIWGTIVLLVVGYLVVTISSGYKDKSKQTQQIKAQNSAQID